VFLSPRRRKASVRRGATAVEFAIVSSVLFLVVFGMIELGRGYMVKHQLTEAARRGCRTGVVEGKANSDISAEVSAYLAASGLSMATTQVLINGFPVDASAANPEDLITVVVSAPVSQVTWLPGGTFLKGSISGQFSMRRE